MHGCAGRLLNRFSSDAAIVDDALPFSANLLFANVAGLLGLAMVILYTQPVIAIAILPLAVVYRQAELMQSCPCRTCPPSSRNAVLSIVALPCSCFAALREPAGPSTHIQKAFHALRDPC